MNVFTDVYNKSRGLLMAQSLASDWQKTERSLKTLLGAKGPNVSKAQVLEDLRKQLKNAGKGKLLRSSAIADEILSASKPDHFGFQDRAAMIKAMYHFYLVQKKGNQNVWVVDFPKAYDKWTFDRFDGKTKEAVKSDLKKNSEVFGSSNRSMMSDSLQLGRKWSADVEVALGNKDDDLKATVKRWFHEDDATDQAVLASIATLAAGFKKIHAAFNSSEVIFSDRPHLRASGEWDNVYASVNSADVMPVIYLYQLFLKTGKRTLFGTIPKLWLCALTVVHELSHKLVRTKDIRYDDDGLKPGVGFASDKALTNADSWAYFAADVVGALSKATIKKVLV